jgi:hypothetical protein
MNNKNLNDAFNLVPIDTPVVPEIVSTPVVLEQDIEKDIQKARQVHHDLLSTSKDALDNLLNFAKQSESPRAYEVVANLIKTTSDVAKTLVDLNKSKKEEPAAQNNTQNNIFLGSTAELQKLIRDGKLDTTD